MDRMKGNRRMASAQRGDDNCCQLTHATCPSVVLASVSLLRQSGLTELEQLQLKLHESCCKSAVQCNEAIAEKTDSSSER
jgi:hypothetical protein